MFNLYLMKISSLDPKNILLRDQRVVKMHLFFMRKFIGYPYTAGYGGIQESSVFIFIITEVSEQLEKNAASRL